jgi:hypothetical protein
MVTMVALVPIANAEQGDAEDSALTQQMLTHGKQPTRTESSAAYGDSGKVTTQSGRAVSNNETDRKNGQ